MPTPTPAADGAHDRSPRAPRPTRPDPSIPPTAPTGPGALLGGRRVRLLPAILALALGMVTKVVPDAEVDAAARALALSLAEGPSVTLGYIKRNINNAETMTLEACFDAEAVHHSRCSDTEDHKEAAKAFVEKRAPVFRGR